YMVRYRPVPSLLSCLLYPRRFPLQLLRLRFTSTWPPLLADLPGFCPLFASRSAVSGKLPRETRPSRRCPQWPTHFAEQSRRASGVQRSRPSTLERRIAALAKTENSMALPPEPPLAADNGCNSGSPSSRPLPRRESAPRFRRTNGTPTRILLLHRPPSETSCPFRWSSSGQNSLFRSPESLPP